MFKVKAKLRETQKTKTERKKDRQREVRGIESKRKMKRVKKDYEREGVYVIRKKGRNRKNKE